MILKSALQIHFISTTNGANTFKVHRKTAQFEPNQKVLGATDKHGVTS